MAEINKVFSGDILDDMRKEKHSSESERVKYKMYAQTFWHIMSYIHGRLAVGGVLLFTAPVLGIWWVQET